MPIVNFQSGYRLMSGDDMNTSFASLMPNTGGSFTGLFNELAADNISAAGTTQAGATVLTTQTTRLSTVAAGAGVRLPPSAAGLELVVINHGANPVQVYGGGSDTIDDIATAIGVSQMSGSVVIYACTTAGSWYTEGLATGYSGGYQTMSAKDSITAHAGGGQGSAAALPSMLNRLSVCATGGDSAVLPASAPGLNITVTNAGAASANVFPATGEQINALGANTAFALASTKTCEFICYTAGLWHTLLSA